jgi:putative flippase GtrA
MMIARPVPPSSTSATPATFWRSVVTSLFTTALDFGTLVGLTELAGVNYVVATWIGTVVGSLSNFTINKLWAFYASDHPALPALARFVLVQVGASGLHTAGVWALTRFAHLPYPYSKLVVAVAVYLGWNYPLNRWFVFARRTSQAKASDARSGAST